eukprot:scaffold21222_cov54-Phaeocystis_antarctica.AAC.2
MKKRPSSRPRKGAMSASIWNRNLVSANSTPARNCHRRGARVSRGAGGPAWDPACSSGVRGLRGVRRPGCRSARGRG